MRKYVCPTPKHECNGTTFRATNIGLRQSIKAHNTPEEAFRCYVAHLKKQGYKQTGARTFQREGEPVKILTKKSKFGAVLRGGKMSKDTGRRVVPYNMLTGIIVSE